ncbi:ceramidase domain-containing protein [uncultured Aquimarina sp.]|uniref:ceramidase domain-containing protein n=1 Tax=uncultured Aquimarina sp. TaxID=575652 RepID=UPI0026373190|nr:ceramidase domain-containing protein [uncultured Aquimarina sp.]
MKKENIGAVLLFVLGVMAVLILFYIDPIPQDEAYHMFSDRRSIMNIPNCWNVISNYPFVIVGGLGVIYFTRNNKLHFSYMLLFLGVILIAVGSGYYHLFPSSYSLVWDRLPMTIVFMTLFSIIIREFISVRLGRLMLLPLILIGLSSILYWVYGESGDLRFYGLIQFYPMVAIPVILIFFKSKYTKGLEYWVLLVFYMAAKVLEHFDDQVYQFLGFISGHSLKHILAATGLYFLLSFYKKRTELGEKSFKVSSNSNSLSEQFFPK